MESENLSTAASRFGPRSATELVGDKEPRPAPKPSPVTTLASASGPSSGRDTCQLNQLNNYSRQHAVLHCKAVAFIFYRRYVSVMPRVLQIIRRSFSVSCSILDFMVQNNIILTTFRKRAICRRPLRRNGATFRNFREEIV